VRWALLGNSWRSAVSVDCGSTMADVGLAAGPREGRGGGAAGNEIYWRGCGSSRSLAPICHTNQPRSLAPRETERKAPAFPACARLYISGYQPSTASRRCTGSRQANHAPSPLRPNPRIRPRRPWMTIARGVRGVRVEGRLRVRPAVIKLELSSSIIRWWNHGREIRLTPSPDTRAFSARKSGTYASRTFSCPGTSQRTSLKSF
jgi:hypothetical protein